MLKSTVILYEEILRRRLAKEARSLAQNLIYFANGLELYGVGYRFNTLGEVGGRGAAIDNLCGEVGAYQNVLRCLEASCPPKN